MQSSFRTHFLYWILPTVVTLLCILFYFFDFFGASWIISPEYNREFGVVEHLEAVLLFIMFVIAVKAVGTKKNRIEKGMFILIAALSLFMFLEEVDYGLHHYDYFFKNQIDDYSDYNKNQVRNVHSTGNLTKILKAASNIFIVVFFVLLPLAAKYYRNKKSPFLQYLAPSTNIIATVISLLLLHQLAFYLYRQNFHTNRSLDGNISEFEELMLYYAIMLYIYEIASKKKVFPIGLNRNK